MSVHCTKKLFSPKSRKGHSAEVQSGTPKVLALFLVRLFHCFICYVLPCCAPHCFFCTAIISTYRFSSLVAETREELWRRGGSQHLRKFPSLLTFPPAFLRLPVATAALRAASATSKMERDQPGIKIIWKFIFILCYPVNNIWQYISPKNNGN